MGLYTQHYSEPNGLRFSRRSVSKIAYDAPCDTDMTLDQEVVSETFFVLFLVRPNINVISHNALFSDPKSFAGLDQEGRLAVDK